MFSVQQYWGKIVSEEAVLWANYGMISDVDMVHANLLFPLSPTSRAPHFCPTVFDCSCLNQCSGLECLESRCPEQRYQGEKCPRAAVQKHISERMNRWHRVSLNSMVRTLGNDKYADNSGVGFAAPSFDNNKTKISIVYLFMPWLQEFQQLLPLKSGKYFPQFILTAHLIFLGGVEI